MCQKTWKKQTHWRWFKLSPDHSSLIWYPDKKCRKYHSIAISDIMTVDDTFSNVRFFKQTNNFSCVCLKRKKINDLFDYSINTKKRRQTKSKTKSSVFFRFLCVCFAKKRVFFRNLENVRLIQNPASYFVITHKDSKNRLQQLELMAKRYDIAALWVLGLRKLNFSQRFSFFLAHENFMRCESLERTPFMLSFKPLSMKIHSFPKKKWT